MKETYCFSKNVDHFNLLVVTIIFVDERKGIIAEIRRIRSSECGNRNEKPGKRSLKKADVEIWLLKENEIHFSQERFVRSVKEECLSKLLLFGEESLLHALKEYVAHYHEERNHQGKDNVILFHGANFNPERVDTSIECKERLGGLLKFYYGKAA